MIFLLLLNYQIDLHCILPNTIPITQKPILKYFIFYRVVLYTAYITFPLLLLTSYQPHYHTLPPLHVHLYLTYFLYILSSIQFSHMYNVHCTLPSHAIPSHVTSLHILPIIHILHITYHILHILHIIRSRLI